MIQNGDFEVVVPLLTDLIDFFQFYNTILCIEGLPKVCVSRLVENHSLIIVMPITEDIVLDNFKLLADGGGLLIKGRLFQEPISFQKGETLEVTFTRNQ